MTQLELATRTALPDYLRVLANKYPRPDWEAHSNFDEITRFWLSRHIMFREVLDRLQNDTQLLIERKPDDQSRTTLHRMTSFFLQQLHEHHTIEDRHYFPMLIPLDASMKKAFDILDKDHHALDRNIHDLAQKTNDLLMALQSGTDIRPTAQIVLDTQSNFKTFLNRHLTDEEEIIVPVILEYGPDMG